MAQKKRSFGIRIIVSLGGLVLALAIVLLVITYHPAPAQSENIGYVRDASLLQPGQKLRILIWNVNGFMGERKFDPLTSAVTDSVSGIARRIEGVADAIEAANPDIVLLQEVPDGDSRAGRQECLKSLVALLGTNYACYTSAYYLKSAFMPRKGINDAVGIKVAVISRYQFTGALRYQLPAPDWGLLKSFFYYKRCALQIRLPVEGGDDLIVMNTHLDATHITQQTVYKQLEKLGSLTRYLDTSFVSWILGGDFKINTSGSRRTDNEDAHFIETVIQQTALLPDMPAVENGTNAQLPANALFDKMFSYIFLSTNVGSVSNKAFYLTNVKLSDSYPLFAEITVPWRGE